MIVHQHPFPHAVEYDLFDIDLCRRAASQFPEPTDPSWWRFNNPREVKLASTSRSLEEYPSAIAELLRELTSPRWCAKLGEAFGIGPVTPDLHGGGMHLIPPGGRLAMHVDFNRHPDGRWRRLNCLLYLNDGWVGGMGGELLLKGDGEPIGEWAAVPPTMGACAVLATGPSSWHGHPTPTVGFWRKSLACYYYSDTPAPGDEAGVHDTIFTEE